MKLNKIKLVWSFGFLSESHWQMTPGCHKTTYRTDLTGDITLEDYILELLLSRSRTHFNKSSLVFSL